MNDQFWLWIGVAGMSAGAALILLTGGSRTPREGMATILHGIVPIIAACSYFAMAVGQGSIVLPSGVPGAGSGYDFYFARYIDWLFTTPILLIALSLTAMHAGVRRPGLLVGIVLSDVLMIVTALFFGLSTVPWIKWTWFAISCGAFLPVYYLIWGPLLAEASHQREDVRATYRRSAVILSVVWLVYPVLLLIDPEGLRYIGSTASVAAFAVVDLIAKVAYGLLATSEHGKIAKADVAQGASARTSLEEPRTVAAMPHAASRAPAARVG
ncbi:rhodopsin [Roseomonas nepalensis]|uniref:Rhodopsin n=1 Tax=Muricoccus nepalensis TaxID=1854500 RepID=A0A502GBB7_9PROT|nr:bacteriorhodopsin [Roseomonas nepalensis]TPG59011.1 rhodopsin [Roseomonas nepalensis]